MKCLASIGILEVKSSVNEIIFEVKLLICSSLTVLCLPVSAQVEASGRNKVSFPHRS